MNNPAEKPAPSYNTNHYFLPFSSKSQSGDYRAINIAREKSSGIKPAQSLQ